MSFDPVDIEIRMRQNVEEESAKASRAIDGISSSSERARKELAKDINLQREVLARLTAELSEAEKAFNKANKSTHDPKVLQERQRLSAHYKELRVEVAREEKSLKDLNKQYETLGNKSRTLERQMYDIRQAMIAKVHEGKKETDEYKKLEEQLQSLSVAYREVRTTQQGLAKGGMQLQGIISGLSAITGLLSAGGGALGLINENSEDFEKIQTRVQSMMAITIGLSQVQNALHQTSAFRIRTVASAKQLWTAANTKLAVSLGISTVAAKVLMATLTLGLSVVIVGVMSALDSFISKQRQAREEAKKMTDSVAQNTTEQLTLYEKLRKAYVALGKDMKAQNKFILENQDKFNQLGQSVTTLNDADNLFVDNTDAFKTAIIERAKAAAAMELASEKYKEIIKGMIEVEAMSDKVTTFTSGGTFGASTSYQVENEKKIEKKKKIEKAEKEFDNFISKAIAHEEKASDAQKEGNLNSAKKLIEGTKAWWEAKRKLAQAKIEAFKDSEIGGKEWKKAEKEFKDADKKVKSFDISEKKSENSLNKRKQAQKKLSQFSLQFQDELDAAIVAAMQDGTEKKLAEIDSEYDKRKRLIESRRKEIEEIEKTTGVDGSKQKEELYELARAEQAKFEAGRANIEQGSADAISAIWKEINGRFTTETQNRLDEVDRFYREALKKAKANATSQDEFAKVSAKIETERLRDRELTKNEIALRELDFENQILLRKEEIRDEQFSLATDREERLLNIQIEGAKKRLAKLKEIKQGGGDVAKEIESTTQSIRELTAAINEIPEKKLKEMAGHLRGMLSSVANAVGGDLGESLSAIADGVDSVMASFDSGASTADHISNAVANLAKLYALASQQAEENKKKQEEWNNTIEESAHRARLARIEAFQHKGDNVFGVENPYAKAIAGAKQYSTAMTELNSTLAKLGGGQVQTGTKKVVSGKNIAKGAGAGAAVGASIGAIAGSIIPGIGTAVVGAVGAAIGAIAGGIFGATQKKIVPVFESLTKQYGSILKKGTKSFELNPKILQDYSKLDNATKKLVDNWEELRKKAIEAEKQIEQTIKELAGDIGSALSKSLVDAFRNGDVFGAVDSFHDKVSDVIGSILEQAIFAHHFEKMFKTLKDRMKESFGEDGDKTIVDDIIWFSQEYKKGIAAFGEDMKMAQEEMKRQGFDIFQNKDGRSAVAKGIAQASQDSIDSLLGSVTYITMRMEGLYISSSAQLDTAKEMLNASHAMIGVLDIIAEHTAFCAYLKEIKEGIDNINRIGIIVKR